MRITKIALENFKDITGDLELTGRDLIIGPPGAGKSARLAVIPLVAHGYIPASSGSEACKTNDDIFRFASGSHMRVAIHMEGATFARKWTRKEKAKGIVVEEEVEVYPQQGERTDTERKARIAQVFAGSKMFFDFSEFLSLSDAKKREFLFGMAASTATWTVDGIIERLRKEVPGSAPEQLRPTVSKVLEEGIAQVPTSLAPADFLSALYKWSSEARNRFHDEKRGAEKATREINDLKHEIEETDRGLDEMKAERRKVEEQRVDIAGSLAQAEERLQEVQRREQRKAALQAVIQALQQQIASFSTAAIDGQIAEARAKADAINSRMSAPVAALSEDPLYEETQKALASIPGQLKEVRQRLAAIRAQRAELAPKLRRAHDLVTSLDRTIQNAEGVAGAPKALCVISPLISCPKDWATALPKMREMFEQANQEWGSLGARDQELEGREKAAAADEQVVVDRESVLRDKVQALEEAHRKKREAAAEIAKAQAEERDQHLKRATELETEKAQKIQEIEAKKATLAEKESDLKDLLNLPALPLAPKEETEKLAASLKERLETITATIEEKTRARNALEMEMRTIQHAREAAEKAEAATLIATAAGPKGMQGELVKASIGPLEGRITEILQEMGIEHQFFFRTISDRGNEVFRFGWTKGGREVEFAALSKGQKLLTVAAILTAFVEAMPSPPAVKVLLVDDLDGVSTFQEMVLRGLLSLEAWDNILVAGALWPGTDTASWNVVEAREVVAAHAAD